jgi:uncharacterized protein YprB with RNaseH-like and TPR domain
MLKRTFIHLPGVGHRTEAHFWRKGFLCWEDFLGASHIRGFSRERLERLKEAVHESLAQVDNPAYFAPLLPASEQWRLFRRFRPRAACLDIETTGTFWPGLTVTVVGLYDGTRFRQFVQGHNLHEFPQALEDFDLLITYNGTQFDLPVLRAYFGHLPLPPVHLDLRFILARLGFRGGLKGIEPRFGIVRPPEVAGLDGYMAVVLWDRYQRGDRTALDLLLTYNREDVINLELLMERAFELCAHRLLSQAGALDNHPGPSPVNQPDEF